MTGPERLPVSACVLTLNEEKPLPDCLASLAFCDDIVVVDADERVTPALRDAIAHDRIEVSGPVKNLSAPLEHYPFRVFKKYLKLYELGQGLDEPPE